MTLPFRRRHHDDDASHDRARSLLSAQLDGPLPDLDSAWLVDHLQRCPECATDERAYADDQALLRSLRDRPIPPPRDLWARTAAAIEREATTVGPGSRRDSVLGQIGVLAARQRLPIGVLSGALVALVILVVALLPPGAPIVPNPSSGASPVAGATVQAAPTPLLIANADRVAWVEQTAGGGYAIVFAPVDQACPATDTTCAPLAPGSPAPVALGAEPQAVILSPQNNQVAVVGGGQDGSDAVVIVAVPTPRPTGSGAESSPAPASASPVPLATASGGPATSAPASAPPTASPRATEAPEPSGSAAFGGQAIIRGVDVIGNAGYSADGTWLAFSARPASGDAGPFLYVWHIGDPAARELTTEGMTYFAGWLGDEVLASTVTPGSDAATGSPTAEASAAPAVASTAPSEVASSEPAPVEAHPTSFLLDPSTGARTAFRTADVWLPSIDPTGRFVAYWSGTLQPVLTTAADGSQQVSGWRPGTGRLVLDGWSGPLAIPSPTASAAVGASAGASAEASGAPQAPSETPASAASSADLAPGSAGPGDSGTAEVAAGPAGTPIELAAGPIDAFDVRFDPTGTRLAAWVADQGDAGVGRLWLVVLDPAAGAPRTAVQPLPAPGVPALRGFSLLAGRLGWVTPPGQNGLPSSVQVLAWTGDAFGQVQTVPGDTVQIVR